MPNQYIDPILMNDFQSCEYPFLALDIPDIDNVSRYPSFEYNMPLVCEIARVLSLYPDELDYSTRYSGSFVTIKP